MENLAPFLKTKSATKATVEFIFRDIRLGKQMIPEFSGDGEAAWKESFLREISKTIFLAEFILAQEADKPPKGQLKLRLEMAIAQVLAGFGPDRQVVSETVSWIKKDFGPAAGGFANKILRNVVARRAEWLTENTLAETAPALFWEVSSQLGPEFFSRFSQLTSRARALEFGQKILNAPPNFVRTASGETLPWDGKALAKDQIIQDLSNQLAVNAVIAAAKKNFARPPESIRVLDRCAAPGGKSIALSWAGFNVTACDKNPARLHGLLLNAERVAQSIEVLAESELLAEAPSRQWDIVWVDAPCTAAGTVLRHPEVRFKSIAAALESLAPIQNGLLADAAARVASGGLLVYSVCSYFKEEGAFRMRDFIKKYAHLSMLEEIHLGQLLGAGQDGLYYAILVRDR